MAGAGDCAIIHQHRQSNTSEDRRVISETASLLNTGGGRNYFVVAGNNQVRPRRHNAPETFVGRGHITLMYILSGNITLMVVCTLGPGNRLDLRIRWFPWPRQPLV